MTFTDSDHGQRLTSSLVMVSHPWLQYYVVAASFAIFGENAFAARLPFALAGLGTIVLVYVLTFGATASRRAAVAATVLLLGSAQFLIFARQSRHYSLHAFLTCLLIWQFLRVRSIGSALALAGIGILLFHAHPAGLAAIAALTALTFVMPAFAPQRRWMLGASAIVMVTSLPWLLAGRAGYEENTSLLDGAGQFLPRLAQFVAECASVTPVVAIAASAAILWWRHRWRILTTTESRFIAAMLAVGIGDAGLIAASQSRDAQWIAGVRHVPAVLPFAMMIAGVLIAKLAQRRAAWAALLALLSVTTLGRITPWAVWAVPSADRNPVGLATLHVPPAVTDRWLRTSLTSQVESLFIPNPGTISRISDFLRAHGRPGDIVVTNYEWDALYFHTGLPQGLKVAPTDPILASVIAHHLPRYVYDGGKVRWIVWRRAWGDEWGQNCRALIGALLNASVPVRLVANMPETLWENRENVHFRRYPGNRYVFPWYGTLPDAEIYRVDWPAGRDNVRGNVRGSVRF